jgi:transcriptional regulator with XRE-family HTH domain
VAETTTRTRRRVRAASDVEEFFRLNLPEARKDRDLTQAQLAREMVRFGYPTTTTVIARIESGERKVTLEEAIVITTVLGCQLAHLIAAPSANKIRITKKVTVTAAQFRDWLRGVQPIFPDLVRFYFTGRLVNEGDFNAFVSGGTRGGFGPDLPEAD